MGLAFSSGRRNTGSHQCKTAKSSWSQHWVTLKRFISRTVRRIKCVVKSNTEAAETWVREQWDNITYWTGPFIGVAHSAFQGISGIINFVLRPIVPVICWTLRLCITIGKFILPILSSLLFNGLIVGGAILFLILPPPVQIFLILLYAILWISSVVIGISLKAIRYLASRAFDCLSTANCRAEWWLLLLGRVGCICVMSASFCGPELLFAPAVALALVISYAGLPLVTWIFDRTIINLGSPPTLNHIKIQILRAIKEFYRRLRTGLRSLFRGLIPSRLAPLISFSIFATLLGPAANTAPHIITAALGIVFALRRDPVAGPYMDSFFAWVAETVDPILDWILVLSGVDRAQVSEWLRFLQAYLMRMVSNVIIAIPLLRIEEEALLHLPRGWAAVAAVGVAATATLVVVTTLVIIFRRRREFMQGERLRNAQASRPFDTSRGVPVYCSQRAAFGSLNHQVLMVDHHDVGPHKYELNIPNYDGQAQATYSCSPVERNRAQRTVPLTNSGDDFYVYLIGWTTMSHTDIDTFCQTLMPWNYSSTRSNCQHFIRRVGRHIVTTQALDWGFFADGEETPYQSWLFSQWRIQWPMWLLDTAFVVCIPTYFIARYALY